MERTMTLSISVYSNDNDWLTTLYGREPKAYDAIQLAKDDIGVLYRKTREQGKGFGLTEIIADLVVDVGIGVQAGIVANFIYDKVMNKGKNKIVIIEEEITILTKDELVTYVKKRLEKEE